MATNRGKQFEGVVHKCFASVPDTSVTRLKDDTMHKKGVANPCDFLVFHKPYLYAIECKSVHGNTLSIYSKSKDTKHPHDYGNITNKQWEGLLEMSLVKGVFAGVLCWWVNKDVTMFIPIQMLKAIRDSGAKSVRYDCDMFTDGTQMFTATQLTGRKKRILFEYDVAKFFKEME